jgi:lipopolysaccharide export system protein LptA
MRWQKIARAAIALFVVAFAAAVFLSMRERMGAPAPNEAAPRAIDEKAIVEMGPGQSEQTTNGKLVFSLAWKNHLVYKDQSSKLVGITLVLPDRNGRTFSIRADEGQVAQSTDNAQTALKTALFKGNVVLTTDNGIKVMASEATYNDAEGMLRIPGAVEFSRDRMKGSGVGATYDKTRDVLWILEQAHVTVAPDAAGAGALEANAGSAGLARADNYMKLVKDARIVSEGKTAQASEITLILDETGQKIQQMQLREQSRITGTGSGTQSMAAKNIDMTYAPDGRILQHSKLMESAVVELPGTNGGPARRIAGGTIDIGMSPDGAVVTSLDAQDKVQVDLPAEGDGPARQIRSVSLHAVGAPGQGLQNGVFEGGVEFIETRPASGKTAAIDRRARSLKLIADTKPGFGAIQRADFRGNACFVDGPTSAPPARGSTCAGTGRVTAEAPRAVFNIEADQLDLSQSPGETGSGPRLIDTNLDVQALNIHLSPSTHKLKADTEVRSFMRPQSRKDANAASQRQTRVPVMLKQDKQVNVTSNRLEYDGTSEATYSGDALLFQDQSRISADTIVINDQTGNLTARVNVRTTMFFQDEDPKTKVKKPSETKVFADLLVYEDAKRLATYTAAGEKPARLIGAEGDILGDRIELFLKESGNELERAEADGRVSVTLENMYATGKHLVYTAATDEHVLTGDPVVSIQKDDQGKCKQSRGTTLTYRRSEGSIRMEGIGGLAASESKPIDPCPAQLLGPVSR